MSKKVYWVLFSVSSLMQALLMAAIVVLQRLAHSRAGVNHHLYYRKIQYQNRVFTPLNLALFTVAACVIVLVCLAVFIVGARRKNVGGAVVWLLPAVGSIFLVLCLRLPYFTGLLSYPYLVAAVAIALLLMLIDALLYPRKPAGAGGKTR